MQGNYAVGSGAKMNIYTWLTAEKTLIRVVPVGNGDRNYLTLFGINRFLHEKLNVMCTALQEKTAWGTRLRLKHFIKNKKSGSAG